MVGNNFIKIRGAKVHNLKNIDLDIPKNKLVVITGISGSGKSSLAFDTLYLEGQRRYLESLSSYSRQFLGMIDKPEVDKIEGISPAIAIEPRKTGHNPRSTVGTMTEISDYLRLLFAKVGIPYCLKCGKPMDRQSLEEITKEVLKLANNKEIIILASLIQGERESAEGILKEIRRRGFRRVRIDGVIYHLEKALSLAITSKQRYFLEVVIDSLILDKKLDRLRLIDSLKTGLRLGGGQLIIQIKDRLSPIARARSRGKSWRGRKQAEERELIFSEHFFCQECGFFLPEIEPRLFSFNSPQGACPYCHGLGERLEVDPRLVIPNLNLSIAEGAIFPWGPLTHSEKLGNHWRKLQELAEKYKFSLEEPLKNLSQKILHLILYGQGSFEGVIPNLEKRYLETSSDYYRQEIEEYMIKKTCEHCQGKRLKPEARAVKVAGKSIDQIGEIPLAKLKRFFEDLILARIKKISKIQSIPAQEFNRMISTGSNLKIVQSILKEVLERVEVLINLGLHYLTLARTTASLAGGEEQRMRLATSIASKLTGLLYILDEPSVGLHPRDQHKLIENLKRLRDLGNTVIVTEHDPQTIRAADWVIDIGPGAGEKGGRVTFEGKPKELLKSKTLTGDYLAGRKKVEIERRGQKGKPLFLIIKGAKEHNLKNLEVKIPLGRLVCFTGVSGSGKSSLINDILAQALLKKFYKAKTQPGQHQAILGVENLNKVILIDQSPIGRTPRSNPATYSGTYTYIRELFSQTKEARVRGYRPGHFSFNVRGGRCEACEGQGMKRIEMYFLPSLWIECPECQGKRFNKETLAIEYHGKNISEVLAMTIGEALTFFKDIPGLFEKLKTLNEIGLGYIKLGQPAPSLSGGEAQRVKLATELSRKATGKSLYILDEPTTGLHLYDIQKLIWVLKSLVDKGNTVIVVEHQLDFIKNADWIIDLGPEGGEEGGYIVAEGRPEEIAKNKKSYTGQYLKKFFQ